MINLDSGRERKTIAHYVYFFCFHPHNPCWDHCRESIGAIVLLDAINAKLKLVENVRYARVMRTFGPLNVKLSVVEMNRLTENANLRVQKK